MTRYAPAVLEALPMAGADWERIQNDERERIAALAGLERYEPYEPMAHQIAPLGAWDTWLMLAGRGAGKTAAAAHWTNEHVNGPACLPGLPGGHRPAIVAPTLGDAVEACVNGPSGIRRHEPAVRLVNRTGGTYVIWPNGTEAKCFGAFTPEDVERLRAGGNRCMVWAEELAAWRFLDQCWDHLQFGLRLGAHPRVVASTTPKPKRLIRRLVEDATTAVTRATTFENPHLPAHQRARLERDYVGTRLGRQELGGELLTEIPGALWLYSYFDDRRPIPDDLVRVVVSVDPSGGDDPENDEQGICVGGLGADGRGYVLADRSCKMTPAGWGGRAVRAYLDFAADAIVGEANFGGDMVEAVIRMAARSLDVTGVTYRPVHASRGKAIRAQPVAALYEQKRVSHCDVFEELEDELTTWTPESGRSPNRLDALVWALSDLMVREPPAERQVYVY